MGFCLQRQLYFIKICLTLKEHHSILKIQQLLTRWWCTGPFRIIILRKNNLFCLQNNLKQILTYLYKTHTESAHLGKLIHCLKAVVHWLSQKLSKLLIVENLQTAATGDFADRGGMEPVMVVAVPTLHKNTAVAKTFCIHFPTNIIEMNTWEKVE